MAFWPPALPEPMSGRKLDRTYEPRNIHRTNEETPRSNEFQSVYRTKRKLAELTSFGLFTERTKKLPELKSFRVFTERTKKLAEPMSFRVFTERRENLPNQRGLGYLPNERSNGYGFFSLKIREMTFFNPCRECRRMAQTKIQPRRIYKEHIATSVDQLIRVT